MEEIKYKHQMLKKSLAAMKIVLDRIENPPKELEDYRILRDSLIQRFEFTFETFWKYLKLYLQEKLKINLVLGSPRGVIRETKNTGLIDDRETTILLDCIDDRNDTSHSYRDSVAEIISKRTKIYFEVMTTITDRLDPHI